MMTEQDLKEIDLAVWRKRSWRYEKYKQSMPTEFSPTTNWNDIGSIIEDYRISTMPCMFGADCTCGEWIASLPGVDKHHDGATPLIAACLAFLKT